MTVLIWYGGNDRWFFDFSPELFREGVWGLRAKSGEERPKVGTEKKRYRIAQTTTDTQIKRAEGMIV